MRHFLLGTLIAAAGFFVVAAPSPAQQSGGGVGAKAEVRLRAQREELDRIRRERSELEARLGALRGTVHDLSEEVANLDRQAEATARAVASLERQLAAISDEVTIATGDLVRAEDELVVKRAVLHRRLTDIYKRGPLYSAEALLSAESFGGLVARYKYLHLIALRDRSLVHRVEQLRDHIGRQRSNLVVLRRDIELSRSEKEQEQRRLRSLEEERARSLVQARQTARQTEARLQRIARAEARLTSVIAALEETRRRNEASRPNAPRSRSTITTTDVGTLDWPVDGEILYRFGRVVNPNNTTTRWNGIGIAADAGTLVRSVASGQVVVAEPIGTYGLTVIIQHGGGDYSVYGSLARSDVTKGAIVSKGQVVGTVGTADPDLPAHLHFEIRPGGRAMDPMEWLKGESEHRGRR
ncbi:MAG: peptidoglycan DD-metalloendopeptidase family protein [Gemmatimonadaceae bacterium]